MPNKKLTDADKAQIVWLRREGAKTEDIAKKLQISRKTVSKILNEEGNSQMLAEYDQKLQKSMQEFLESQQGTVQALIKQILESSGKDIAKARLGEKMKALKVLIEAFPAKQTDGEIPVRFSLWGKEIQVADWREEHPRDEDGKFADKGGEKKSSAQRIKGVFERRKSKK